MDTQKKLFGVIALITLSFSACDSGDAAAPSTPPPPSISPQQQITSHFSVAKDNQTWLHSSAWKDASGVLWSQSLTTLPTNSTAADLEYGCNRSGETLPTAAQLDQLAKYLGRDSSIGFHPEYLQDPLPGTGMATVWDLRGLALASSTPSPDSSAILGMNGDTGAMEEIPMANGLTQEAVSAICVTPKEKAQVSCQIRTESNCSSFFSGNGPIEYNDGLGDDGNVSAAVFVSNADASGNVTMTLQLYDDSANKTVKKSWPVGANQAEQGAADITDSKTGIAYELICAVGGVATPSLVGEACQPIR